MDSASEGQEAAPQPTLLEQMGGVSGLVSSTLPILVLVPVNNIWGLLPALLAALGVALAIFGWRLLRRENLQPAFSGLVGVGIGAAIAWWTGEARGYFLYGIWMSLLYAVVAFGSIAVGWPLIGVVWKGINGEGMQWRHEPKLRAAYSWATFSWGILFLARFIVKKYLYDTAGTTFLAAISIAMGWPLTAVVTLFTIFVVRRASKRTQEQSQTVQPASVVTPAVKES